MFIYFFFWVPKFFSKYEFKLKINWIFKIINFTSNELERIWKKCDTFYNVFCFIGRNWYSSENHWELELFRESNVKNRERQSGLDHGRKIYFLQTHTLANFISVSYEKSQSDAKDAFLPRHESHQSRSDVASCILICRSSWLHHLDMVRERYKSLLLLIE